MPGWRSSSEPGLRHSRRDGGSSRDRAGFPTNVGFHKTVGGGKLANVIAGERHGLYRWIVLKTNFRQDDSFARTSPLKILRDCRLTRILRNLGWRDLVSLFRSGGDGREDYSLKPFIRTKSIFVHVPKTGGVSINRALYGTLGMGHLRMRDYRALFRPRAFAEMFKFTFVRNPFDRLHSAYHFLRAGGMDGLDLEFDQRVLTNFPSFEHFVLEGLENEEVTSFWHFIPQSEFLTSEDGSVHDFDFVGRYETLAQDFEVVRARVNPSAELPHFNRTPVKDGDYRRVYTPEMVDRVAQKYAPALDLLGYEFDGAKRPMKVPGSKSSAGR